MLGRMAIAGVGVDQLPIGPANPGGSILVDLVEDGEVQAEVQERIDLAVVRVFPVDDLFIVGDLGLVFRVLAHEVDQALLLGVHRLLGAGLLHNGGELGSQGRAVLWEHWAVVLGGVRGMVDLESEVVMSKDTPIGGINSVRAALGFGAEGVSALWLDRRRRDRRLAELAALARSAGVRVRQVERGELDAGASGINHQGALAWVKAPAGRKAQDLDELLDGLDGPPLLLVLDGVTDPHNLGACLRSADGAGVHALIAPKDKAAGLTPVAVKVASGAAESVPFVQVTNLARTLDALKERGIWLIGTAGESGQTLFDTDLTGPTALVLGSEGKGLRRLTRERCDLMVRLPMQGRVESLNVSVAAGVCLYEALRQRLACP